MEFKKMLVGPERYLICAHVLYRLCEADVVMSSWEGMCLKWGTVGEANMYNCTGCCVHWATSGWSLPKIWVTPWMEFIQNLSYPRPASIYKLLFPLGKRRDGLSCDQTYKEVGLPRMESALQTSTCCCFLLGYLWMESTEKIGHPGWNQD
jgi:hypothetical protein